MVKRSSDEVEGFSEKMWGLILCRMGMKNSKKVIDQLGRLRRAQLEKDKSGGEKGAGVVKQC